MTRRREFLLGAAGLTESWLAAPFPAAAAIPGLHLGCVTHRSLEDYDLETIIKLLEAADFEAVELRTEHKHGVEPSISQAERARVRQRFESSKVKLLSYGTICEFHSPDAAERRRQVEIGESFVDLAKDTGAIGIKVRPNGWGEGVSHEVTIHNIGASLRELGDYGAQRGIAIWLEVHGGTGDAKPMQAIMQAAQHKNVGICWNSVPRDIVNGSVKQTFELLKPWIRNVHIHDLADRSYPYRELFSLLRDAGYNRYTLFEGEGNPQTERFLKFYKALWTEYNRFCG